MMNGKNGRKFEMDLRAVSLWPEWTYAIMHLNKLVENRTWPAHRKMIGHRIALHAGKSFGGMSQIPARRYFEPMIELGTKAGYHFKDLYSSEGFRRDWVGFRVFDSDGNERFPLDTRLLSRGAIVATAVLKSSSFLFAGKTSYEDGSEKTVWSAEGNYGWQLGDIQLLETPISMVGNQGIWRVKPEYLGEVMRQINAA
jgi:hypothetical protein